MLSISYERIALLVVKEHDSLSTQKSKQVSSHLPLTSCLHNPTNFICMRPETDP